MKKLASPDYQAIIDELNSRIDGSDINTSGWMPGTDWNGTAFQPIYHACSNDDVSAGLFFGLANQQKMIKK